MFYFNVEKVFVCWVITLKYKEVKFARLLSKFEANQTKHKFDQNWKFYSRSDELITSWQRVFLFDIDIAR